MAEVSPEELEPFTWLQQMELEPFFPEELEPFGDRPYARKPRFGWEDRVAVGQG